MLSWVSEGVRRGDAHAAGPKRWAGVVAAMLGAAVVSGACAKVSGDEPHLGSGTTGTPDAGSGGTMDLSSVDRQGPLEHPALCAPGPGSSCAIVTCGDGVVDLAKEGCDDGNA